jgi:uncharacterized membrane protein YqjE
MDDTGSSGGGIFASLKRCGQTALSAFHNRIELFAVEVREETNWVITAVLWTAALLLLGIMALLVITATIIYLCPAEARGYAFVGFSLVYLAVGVWAFFGLNRHLKARQPPFSATLSELKKDITTFTKND